MALRSYFIVWLQIDKNSNKKYLLISKLFSIDNAPKYIIRSINNRYYNELIITEVCNYILVILVI